MRSILTKVSLLLTLLEIVLASALEPRRTKSPVIYEEFQCGSVTFTGPFLKGVADEVKRKDRLGIFYSKELSRSYNGPPFTRRYLNWPISLGTKSYKKALLGPYRAIIKENYEIFSVIAKGPHGIQECNMIGKVAKFDQKFDFTCGIDHFPFNKLKSAVKVACASIQKIAPQKFPARYDGDHFSESGKQLYIYPIKVNGAFDHESDPGPYRVVLNSACKLAGAITLYDHGETFKCHGTPARG